MKFKNKETEEVRLAELREDGIYLYSESLGQWFKYDLETLGKGWIYHEEPKEDGVDNIIALVEAYSDNDSERYPKEIVEKLKAWKRLREKGFRFGGYALVDGIVRVILDLSPLTLDDLIPDLDLLFGGKE